MRERDCYSVSASKILALTPSCCSPDRSPPPLRQLDSILFSKSAETPDSGGTGGKSGRAWKGRGLRWHHSGPNNCREGRGSDDGTGFKQEQKHVFPQSSTGASREEPMTRVTHAPSARKSTWMSVTSITSTTPAAALGAAYRPAGCGPRRTMGRTRPPTSTAPASSRSRC